MGSDKILFIVLFIAAVGIGAGLFYFLDKGDTTSIDDGTDAVVEDSADSGPKAGVTRKKQTRVVRAGGSRTSPLPDLTSTIDGLPSRGDGIAQILGRVLDPDGNPVRDAIVALCEDVSDLPQHALQGDVFQHTMTNAEGNYLLDGIDPRMRYLVRVEHADYASNRAGVEVSKGEHKTHNVHLQEGMSISGFVFDGEGLPLGDAEIMVVDQAARSMDPSQNVERLAVSSSDGTFVVKNLIAGYKRVTAAKEGFASQTNPTVFLNEGKPVTPIEFRLTSGSFISGACVTPDGNPIEGVVITAQPVRRGGRNVVTENYPSIKTDGEGMFHYPGLLAGTYTLTCHRRGFGNRGTRITARTGDDSVRIEMKPNPVIRGRVIAESGEPIKDFDITLGRHEYFVFDSNRLKQRFFSETGEFTYISDTTNGDFYLFAVADGFAGGRSDSITMTNSDVDGITIVMNKGATVMGRIISRDGTGIGGAMVELVPRMEGSGQPNPFLDLIQRSMRSPSKKTKADKDGRYEFALVTEGHYKVRAKKPGQFSSDESEETTRVSGSGTFDMPDVMLMKGGAIYGTVYDDNGDPEAGSKVQLVAKGQLGGSNYNAVTDAAGKYKISHIRPGVYWVDVVERKGEPSFDLFKRLLQQQQREEIVVADGENLRIDID